MFYFSINGGAFISSIITPKLRADVECFGRLDCFPLAFGLPAILMALAILIFFLGRGRYTHHDAKQNVLLDYAITVWLGIRGLCTRAFSKESSNRAVLADGADGETGAVDVSTKMHWLDPAIGRFGVQFVEHVKIANSILYLFIPLPVFWTLFDQSGSRFLLPFLVFNFALSILLVAKDTHKRTIFQLQPLASRLFLFNHRPRNTFKVSPFLTATSDQYTDSLTAIKGGHSRPAKCGHLIWVRSANFNPT